MSDDRADLLAHLRMLELMGVRFVPAPPAMVGRGVGGGAGSTGSRSGATRDAARPAPPQGGGGNPFLRSVAERPAGVAAASGAGAAPAVVVPPASSAIRIESLEDIRAYIGDCKRCKLCEGRNKIVFGNGDPKAQLMFVGEGPGADEDAQGLPFVGAAGQLLNKIIGAMGLKREEVYVGNVIKCRPPANRTPEEDEIRACSPFIYRQIEVVKPRVVCALGLTAAQTLANSKESMGRMRGKLIDMSFGAHRATFAATYHPAYLLRSPDKKRDTWEDVQKIMAFLRA